MRTFIGCKIIKAEIMDLDTFNKKFNERIPTPIHISTQGYHVQYPNGYNSWSPKDVFEAAYREITEIEKELV